jgi:purine catabolism regulator
MEEFSLDSEFVLTVQEVLKRPLFQNARVVIGNGGLNRRIRWVHILDTFNFTPLIHGEEMILTTGIGINSGVTPPVTFLEKLIKQNVACLCIEVGQYLDSVSEEMIELANRHNFPLILFPHTVRFVDITQDLHSLIINRHHKMLQELESMSREFHRLTLTSQGTLNVLKLLQRSTKAQVIFRPLKGRPSFIPSLQIEEQRNWLDNFIEHLDPLPEMNPDAPPYLWEYHQKPVIVKPLGALGQTWAYIILVYNQKPQEYDYLLLDSASLSIAQDLLRKRYIEERKLYKENLWIDDLLHNRLHTEQIKSLMDPDFTSINESNYRVCLIEIENLNDLHMNSLEDKEESILFHLSLILRSTFEKFSFYPLITQKNNRLVVIALDIQSKVPEKERVRQVFDSLQLISADEKMGNLKLLIGVGKSYVKLIDAHLSYQQAIQSLSLYSCCKKPLLYYEELGVFQLLLNLNDGKTLQSFIDNYLNPLIEHDQSKGSSLLRTLNIYLDNDASKQIAAKKLFIVRQTLYYRLEKISELLGVDFMSPENRLDLQVALRAYQLLNPDKL